MKNIVGLKDFRENLPKYERRIGKGQSFIVMKRSKPLFAVSPVDEDEWETVIDFTKIKKGGVDIHDLLKRL